MARLSELRRWQPILFAVLLAAFFAVFSFMNFLGFERFCTADMYEDTYVARLMWEQKTLFPDNWVFGNQYYVIATPVAAALFYGITGSVNLAMALATTLMTVLTFLSLWWLFSAFADRTESLLGVLVMAASVMGPAIVSTIEGQILYLQASYYSCYVITLFVVYGDYARAVTGKRERFFTVSLLLSVFLSFATGMQSLRQTAVMILPLLLYEGLSLLSRVLKRERIDGKRLAVTARAALVSVANAAGYCLTTYIIKPSGVTIYGKLGFVSGADSLENISTGFRAIRSITGLKYLFGTGGAKFDPVLGLAALIFVIVAAAATVMTALDKKRGEDGLEVILSICVLSFLTVLSVNAVIEISLRSIYLFVWYPIVAISSVIVYRRLGEAKKLIFSAVLAVTVLGNLVMSYGPNVYQLLFLPDTAKSELCEWMRENGRDVLYGEWYMSAEIAAYSDGDIKAGGWTGEPFKIVGYVNPQDIYSEADNEHAAVVVDGLNREAVIAAAESREIELAYAASFGPYEVYISSEQPMFRRSDGD